MHEVRIFLQQPHHPPVYHILERAVCTQIHLLHPVPHTASVGL